MERKKIGEEAPIDSYHKPKTKKAEDRKER